MMTPMRFNEARLYKLKMALRNKFVSKKEAQKICTVGLFMSFHRIGIITIYEETASQLDNEIYRFTHGTAASKFF